MVGEIKYGYMFLVGIIYDDIEVDVEYVVDKIVNLWVFDDESGKMNLLFLDVEGEILLVF